MAHQIEGQEVKDMETPRDFTAIQVAQAAPGPLTGLMPVMGVEEAIRRHKAMVELVKSEIWHDGVDAMVIPGSTRKSLTQPGAQKLAYFFGLSPVFELVDKVEEWDAPVGKTPLFSYTYKCKLYANGRFIAEADGNANSYEAKYRWRWVQESDIPLGIDPKGLKTKGGKISEPRFAIERGETSGRYGKPAEYWQTFRQAIERGEYAVEQRMSRSGNPIEYIVIDSTLYRVANDDIESLVNTIIKISQKRAYVGAVITAANASEFFTQDLEDMSEETRAQVIEGHTTPASHDEETKKAPAPAPAKSEEPAPSGAKGDSGGGKGTQAPPQGEGPKMAPASVRKGKGENPAPWLVNGKHWSQDAGLIKNFTDFLALHQWQLGDFLRVISERDKKGYTQLEEVEMPVGDCMNAMLDWSKAEAARQQAPKPEPERLL